MYEEDIAALLGEYWGMRSVSDGGKPLSRMARGIKLGEMRSPESPMRLSWGIQRLLCICESARAEKSTLNTDAGEMAR